LDPEGLIERRAIVDPRLFTASSLELGETLRVMAT
jgi:hypothetical protein